MADAATSAFANADQRNKEQSAALLAAIAQSGSAGRAAFDQAQTQEGGERQAAIQSALDRAGLINAPQTLAGQLQRQAAAPSDNRIADINQARTVYNQDIGRLGAANADYMKQVGAAIPLVQARTTAQVAQIRAQAEQDARDKAMRRELAQLQADTERKRLDFETQKLDAAKTGQKPLTLAEKKYQDQQTQQASQRFVMDNLGQHASDGTQNAFHDVVDLAGKKGLPSALSLVGKLKQVGHDVVAMGKDADGNAVELARYPSTSVGVLKDWLTRYYNADESTNIAVGQERHRRTQLGGSPSEVGSGGQSYFDRIG